MSSNGSAELPPSITSWMLLFLPSIVSPPSLATDASGRRYSRIRYAAGEVMPCDTGCHQEQ